MSLVDYQPEVRTVTLKGGSFTVKGLSSVEIAKLITHHLPDIEAVYELGESVISGKTGLSDSDISQVAVAIAEDAPGLIANIIALASGETSDEAVAAAGRLPFPVQVQTIMTVLELTFDEVGGVKKGLESIAGLLKTMMSKQTDTPAPLLSTSTTDSDAM